MNAGVRAGLGAWLRKWADRLDDAGAPKRTPFSFTFEHDTGGVRLRQDRRGCPLHYVGRRDYDRAHSEADTAHVVIDWSAVAAVPGRPRQPRRMFEYRGGGQSERDAR